jgi:hypothetical protein
MDISKNKITCEQAKQLDIVEYLSFLGFNPVKIRNADHWYLSPLRNEKTASFKVNKKLNAWYDHGTGQGGNLVDFGILYYNCSVSDLLEKLNNLSFHQQPLHIIAAPEKHPDPQIKIVSEKNLFSLSVLRYLRQRRIAESVSNIYCREVFFELNTKAYSAIGFRNDEGGFELRNSWFKGSSSPKTFTSFCNDAKEVSVFEGFFDFLSYQTIHQYQAPFSSDFLILNSTSFFERSRSFMERHNCIRLYLDRDKTGQNCTQKAMESSKKYIDESNLYKGYNDLNEWTQHIGKSQKKGFRQSLQ